MFRHVLRGLLYAVILLIVLLIGAIGLVQTGPGKRFAAAQISSMLSTPESGIEIRGIEGWIPLDMRLAEVRLSDAGGVWLAASDIVAAWSPGALLRGRIEIDEVSAGRIEIARPPLAGDAAEPETSEPFRLPELPRSLLPVTIERLAAPRIDLGAPVLGEAASFALDGTLTATDDGKAVDLSLDLQRTDKPTAFATLVATVNLDQRSLALDLDAGDTGGLLARITGRPDAGDLDLSLDGDGPLDAWTGVLRANAAGLAEAELDLSLALVDLPRFGVEGAVRPAPSLLPRGLAGLVGDQVEIGLAVVQTRAQALAIERIDVGNRQAGLTLQGSVDFEAGDLALTAAVDLPDLGAFSALAGTTLAGAAGLTLDLAGTLKAPQGRLDLRIDRLGYDDIRIAGLATAIDLATTAPLDSDRPSFDIGMSGRADGLVIPDTPLPDPTIAWRAKVAAPLAGAIAIEDASIETAGASLSAKGRADPVTLVSDLALELKAPSLHRLVVPFGQEIDGKALIAAAIKASADAADVAVDLTGKLEQLVHLPPGAEEILGDAVDLKAKLRLSDLERLEIATLALDGAEVALTGQGGLDLAKDDLSATLALSLPRLAALGPLTGQPFGGAVDLEADLAGSLTSPQVDLTLFGKDLVLAGEPVERLRLDLAASDLATSPQGHLQLDLAARGVPAALGVDYRLDGGTLRLPRVALTGPKASLEGALDVDLHRTLVTGKLEGGISDLSAWQAMLQQPLRGSLDLDARLAPAQQRQDAVLSLDGRRIAGEFGEVGRVSVKATLRDLLGKPGLDANATVSGFRQGTTEIAALSLGAKGDLERLRFDLDLRGDVTQPVTLAAGGALSLAGPIVLTLDRLAGDVAGEALRLSNPARFAQDDQTLRLAGLDLRLGDASLRGDVEIGATAVKGAIELRSLPFAWLAKFDGPAIGGTAGAKIDLGGAPARPRIEAAVDLQNLRVQEATAADLPPVDVALRARLANGRMDADLQASGLTGKPITARASLPVDLALRPFAFTLPEDGRLDGDIQAEILLARVADFLALDEQKLEGRLTANLALAGTAGAPLVEGPIGLEGGVYENYLTGTSLRDLTMKATASSERIGIDRLSGRVGKKGTLNATGSMDIDPAASFPLSVSLLLKEADLVNRDDVEARISGEVSMTGDLADAQIDGRLTVDRAEISIPEGGGPNLPELQVEEVGGRIVNPPEEEADAGPPFDPELDVQVDLPGRIYVRGRGLDSEWQGNLEITGRSSDPRIVGDLSIKKGYFDFLDKRFDLRRGEIAFAGASPPNPVLAVEAAAGDDEFTAIIKVDGPVDDPKLTLESEPALPEDEVLARLLFNRELSEIGAIEAGKLALALNRLRGGGGFDAFGEIRNVLNIDTLDIVGGETPEESKVKAGKYLSDDVYVEVEKGAADQSGRARVEVEILPSISLEADTGEDATGGVGLKWRFDY